MTPIDVTDCPYYLLSRATLAVTAALKKELEKVGAQRVRPAYLGVLMSLWKENGLKAVELCRRAGIEPSSMTGLLDRMEADGLVQRGADPEDRRAQRIALTEEGRRVRVAVETVVTRTLDRVLTDVREGDVERLKKVLRQVLTNANRLGPT